MEKKKAKIWWRKSILTIYLFKPNEEKGEEEIRKVVLGRKRSRKWWRRGKYEIGRYMGVLLGMSQTFGPHVIFQELYERSVYLIKYNSHWPHIHLRRNPVMGYYDCCVRFQETKETNKRNGKDRREERRGMVRTEERREEERNGMVGTEERRE
jgi:hypothetical protein